MKDRGFTLIELLAVLVILAIIALIAVPIIQNMIRDSRKNATLRSAEFYMDAIDQAISIRQTDIEFDVADGIYEIDKNGNICLNDDCSEILEVEVENTKPVSGSVEVENNRVVSVSDLYFPKYKYSVSTSNGSLVASKSTNTNTYKSGDIVYFDVASGNVCTENKYKESLGEYEYKYWINDWETKIVTDYGNSANGYNGIDNKDENQNSCLKFYVVSSSNNKVTLILDHNTSEAISWADLDDGNNNGPQVALMRLNDDTKSWKGTLTPTNYTYKRNQNSCYITGEEDNNISFNCDAIDYTIDYTGYKARLITAEEVASIANINTKLGIVQVTSLNQNSISTSELMSKVGWLYDRVYADEYYEMFGIPNKPINNNESAGYWTATASSWFSDEESIDALAIKAANVKSNTIIDSENGIRPVIEVSKDKLK